VLPILVVRQHQLEFQAPAHKFFRIHFKFLWQTGVVVAGLILLMVLLVVALVVLED